jgi:hypothetical protein
MSTNGIPVPASESVQSASFHIRLTTADKEALSKRAEKAGQNLSEWARERLLELPEYDPRQQELRQALLEETIEHYLTVGAEQYKDFLRAAEKLFGPLTEQLRQHREWERQSRSAFISEIKSAVAEASTEVAGKLGQAVETIDRAHQEMKWAMKQQRHEFYQRWL